MIHCSIVWQRFYLDEYNDSKHSKMFCCLSTAFRVKHKHLYIKQHLLLKFNAYLTCMRIDRVSKINRNVFSIQFTVSSSTLYCNTIDREQMHVHLLWAKCKLTIKSSESVERSDFYGEPLVLFNGKTLHLQPEVIDQMSVIMICPPMYFTVDLLLLYTQLFTRPSVSAHQ